VRRERGRVRRAVRQAASAPGGIGGIPLCPLSCAQTDEFVAGGASSLGHLRVALELIRAFAPGSESHTAVAVKYDALARERAELAEYIDKGVVVCSCPRKEEGGTTAVLAPEDRRGGWVNGSMDQ
jgi:hypothetical protein